MPKIAYTSDRFPPPYGAVNGAFDLDVGWPFLVWSAVSVGRAELFHIFRHGQFSLFEIAYREAIVYANLVEDETGRLRRSQAYDGLDPSEKGAISYFLGLTVAKAFSARVLGVPWLMHLDVYRQQLQAVLARRTRPDLVGRTVAGQWVAIESKGRTNDFDAAAHQRAKRQVRSLQRVGGQRLVLRIGMVTHFEDAQLEFRATDPPPRRRRRGLHLRLSPSTFFEGYYRPFRTWLAIEPRAQILERGGVEYLAAPVDAVDTMVGLAVDLVDDKGLVLLGQEHRESEGETYFAGPDGVLVELGPSWMTENMTKEPQERGGPANKLLHGLAHVVPSGSSVRRR